MAHQLINGSEPVNVSATAGIQPLSFFDAPQLLTASVTPIPGSGSSCLQVIADTGFKASIAIDYIDTTGDFIGVYTGVSGQERLACIIGNGQNDRAWAMFPAHSRVSLRSMTASSITAGTLTGTLMGY